MNQPKDNAQNQNQPGAAGSRLAEPTLFCEWCDRRRINFKPKNGIMEAQSLTGKWSPICYRCWLVKRNNPLINFRPLSQNGKLTDDAERRSLKRMVGHSNNQTT